MRKETKGLRENLEGIRVLRQELWLRFALLGHARSGDPALELRAKIRNLDFELDKAYKKVKKFAAGSVEEETCLTFIRELEDKRFQLLSQLNGNHLSGYSR